MNRNTGAAIADDAHLAQSIGDILSTPLGSRVMRRTYGSLLFELIDQPANPTTRIRLFAATAMALMQWEPRIRVTQLALTAGARAGAFVLTLTGQRTDTPAPSALTQLSIPLQLGPLSSAA